MFATKLDFLQSVYFDQDYYLQNKADALSAGKYWGKTDWTANEVEWLLWSQADMTPWEHFHQYGAFEKAADGSIGLNPSKYFDMETYYIEKAAQYQESSGVSYTAASIAEIFMSAGLDPITHFSEYGVYEMLSPRLEDMSAVAYNEKTGIPMSGEYKIDALLHGAGWSTDLNETGLTQGNTLYYSFPAVKPVQYFSSRNLENFEELNANQKEGVHTAASYIEKVTGIELVYTEDISLANFMFFEASWENEQFGHASGWVAGSNSGASVQAICIGNSITGEDHLKMNEDLRIGTGNYGNYGLILHEWGHALGLKHSFAPSSVSNVVLIGEEDNRIYTQMSYTHYRNGENAWSYADHRKYYSPYDLMALNYIYGTDGLNGEEGLVYTPDFLPTA